MKIFKHQLHYGMNNLFLPSQARFLDVQMQNGNIVIWYLAEDPEGSYDRNILVCFTGKEVNIHTYDIYLGTVQHEDLVYHVFEKL